LKRREEEAERHHQAYLEQTRRTAERHAAQLEKKRQEMIEKDQQEAALLH
jgi:hypothetical protein